jgi:hypothetical protein
MLAGISNVNGGANLSKVLDDRKGEVMEHRLFLWTLRRQPPLAPGKSSLIYRQNVAGLWLLYGAKP